MTSQCTGIPSRSPAGLLVLGFVLAAACGGGSGGDRPRPTDTGPPSQTPAASPSPGPIAWAVGGMLVSRSDDSGASWRAIFNVGMGAVYGVDFVDRLTGWVVGEGNLYRTTVGGGENGSAWESQAHNIEGQPGGLYDVAFSDAERGMAVGAEDAAPARGALIIATEDGGGRWQRVDLGALGLPATAWLTRACLNGEGSGITVGNRFALGTPPVALMTATFGTTWVSVLDPIRATAPDVPLLALAGCACPAPAELWVVGAPSFLAVSVDGGASWSRRFVTSRPDVLLNSVLVDDRARGWVSGFDAAARELVVFTTTDGGASWRERVLVEDIVILEQQPSAALAALSPESILFVGEDPNSFALEGARALSFFSRDAGATWDASLIPGGYQSFVDLDVVP